MVQDCHLSSQCPRMRVKCVPSEQGNPVSLFAFFHHLVLVHHGLCFLAVLFQSESFLLKTLSLSMANCWGTARLGAMFFLHHLGTTFLKQEKLHVISQENNLLPDVPASHSRHLFLRNEFHSYSGVGCTCSSSGWNQEPGWLYGDAQEGHGVTKLLDTWWHGRTCTWPLCPAHEELVAELVPTVLGSASCKIQF